MKDKKAEKSGKADAMRKLREEQAAERERRAVEAQVKEGETAKPVRKGASK